MAVTLPVLTVREQTGEPLFDRIQQRQDDAAGAARSIPWLQGTLLEGLRQEDGSITNGIEFTTGQTRELPHGLGRASRGFLAVGASGSEPLLYQSESTQGLEASHIKLTHAGASTTRVRVWVW